MSLVVKMMIVGWIATLAMMLLCAKRIRQAAQDPEKRRVVAGNLRCSGCRHIRRKPLIRRHERVLTCTRRIDAADS
jgi:hypothetical protein